MIHWGGRGAGHISRSTSGAGNLSAIPVPSGAARFLNSGDGSGSAVTAPIVGQLLYVDPGPFSGALSGYDYQVYSAGVAIPGETGTWLVGTPPPYYLVQDAQVGNTLSVKCHGVNGASVSATTSDSVATSAVADIDLTNAITAFTRTSTSGDNSSATGLVFSLTFGSNVYEGYYLRANVYSDSGLSALTQSVRHLLTNADLQSGATIDFISDGLTKLGPNDWLQLVVEATSPMGIGHSFLYPTALSPTDAVVAMTWSTTDKSATTALSGGNLIATASATWSSVRSSRGIGSGQKIYAELTGDTYPAVADATADLTAAWGGGGGDGSATTHAAEYQPGNGFVFYNGSGTAAAGYTAGATWGIALDTTASPYTAAFYKNNVLQATKSLTSIGATVFIAAQLSTSHTATLNAGTTPGGTTGFTYTPPTGFVAP